MSKKNKIRLQELSHKWLDGTLTKTEQAEFDLWFNEQNELPLNVSADVAQSKGEHEQIIFNRIKEAAGITRPTKSISLWPRIAVAAAIVTIIFGVWLYYTPRHPDASQDPGNAQYATDIAPGKQGATLTLANGKKIKLSDALNGELAKEAGVIVSKTANGQLIYSVANLSPSGRDGEAREGSMINTLSTAKGETYQLRLPDGSMVWLNSASSLTYSSNLVKDGKRIVKLTGEAYFEIAKLHFESSTLSARRASLPRGEKNGRVPFIVQTDKQAIEVLGTHFNVTAYGDEGEVKTTVLEGSVSVRHAEFISASRNGKAILQVLNSRAGVLKQVQDDEVVIATCRGMLFRGPDRFRMTTF